MVNEYQLDRIILLTVISLSSVLSPFNVFTLSHASTIVNVKGLKILLGLIFYVAHCWKVKKRMENYFGGQSLSIVPSKNSDLRRMNLPKNHKSNAINSH